MIDLLGMKIYVFPFILLIAVFACLFAYIANKKKYHDGFADQLRSGFAIALIGAIVFGRILSALVLLRTSNESFFYNMVYGGFVFYGGVIGGLISCSIFCVIKHRSLLDISDVFLGLLPLGQAIGRIGCYLNGCCYGREYTGILSTSYIINGVEVSVFPTWFIESFFCLILAIYFQLICRTTKQGFQTAVYLIAYSTFRFFIEFLRGDNIRGLYGWISTSQIISIVFLGVGFILLIHSNKRNETNIFLNQRRVTYES